MTPKQQFNVWFMDGIVPSNVDAMMKGGVFFKPHERKQFERFFPYPIIDWKKVPPYMGQAPFNVGG